MHAWQNVNNVSVQNCGGPRRISKSKNTSSPVTLVKLPVGLNDQNQFVQLSFLKSPDTPGYWCVWTISHRRPQRDQRFWHWLCWFVEHGSDTLIVVQITVWGESTMKQPKRRFKFPFETSLHFEPIHSKDNTSNYKVEVTTKRNDSRVNNHQCFQLQGWRVNCDIQVVIYCMHVWST